MRLHIMKKHTFSDSAGLCFLWMFGGAIALLPLTGMAYATNVETEQALPTAIADFYHSRNTLSGLGNQVDREIAIDSLMCEGNLPVPTNSRLEYCSYLPAQLSSEQTEIQELALTLEPQIVRTMRDSPMVISEYSPGWGSYLRATRSNAEPLTTSADLFPARIYQPMSVQRHDETALSIEVMSCDLEFEQPWQPLDQDMEQPADNPDFAFGEEATPTCYAPSLERHRWTMTENQWLKLEPDLVLLNP